MNDSVEAAPGHDGRAIARSLADPLEFEAVARRHFESIYRYISRRVGRQLAEDLVSETFLIAFERRSTFNADADNARPWLYGIATNLVRRQARTERRRWAAYGRLIQEHDFLEDPSVALVDRAVASERATKIAKAITKLNKDQRDALHLIALEKLSYDDAAQALGINVGTLRSRLARARRRLQTLTIDDLSDTQHVQGDVPQIDARRS